MKYVPTILAVTAALALAGPAWGQAGGPLPGMTFSADFQGPTAGGPGPFTGTPDFFAMTPIDEGAILTPGLPGPPGPNPPSFPAIGAMLPPPGIMVTPVASGFGTVPGGLGIMPGPLGAFQSVELDALSYGRDIGEEFYFSVEEFAVGIPSGIAPNVRSEGAMGPALEASADVFVYLGGPVAGILPPFPVIGNTGVVDGNGLPSVTGFVYPGVGLIEPNLPTPGSLPDNGDNLDAVDMNTTMNDVRGPIYFSLDSAFADPLEPFPPVNSGTAARNGFAGGDVLVSFASGAPALYAAAPLLGLDRVPGFNPDSDDLDALALLEDGDGVFTPGADMIYFSVRRGSAVIGSLDSMFGVPIEPGDILTIPFTGAGALSPFPAIVIPAESLGLWTFRTSGPNPLTGVHFGDDLDALDMVPEPATMTLLALGACIALGRRKRR